MDSRHHGLPAERPDAYVSAGAHGIGEAIADLLTQEGVQVIVADHDETALGDKAGSGAASSPRISRPPKGVRRSPLPSSRSARLPTS